MHARSISLTCRPEAVDELVGFVRDEVLPTVSGMAGSGDYFATARARMCGIAGDDSPGISRWEIALMHRAHDHAEGGSASVIWATGTGGPDDALERWRTSVLPALEQMPGFCSVSLLVDRDTRHAVATTVYDSLADLEGNAGAGAALRDRFGEEAGMTVEDMARFDVVVAHLRVPELT